MFVGEAPGSHEVQEGRPFVGAAGARLNLLAYNDSIHWARLSMSGGAAKSYTGEEGVRIQESYQEIYLGTLVTVDMCYGTVQNRTDSAVKIRSHSVAAGL